MSVESHAQSGDVEDDVERPVLRESWPQTRLVSAALLLVLSAAMGFPLLAGGPALVIAVPLVVPVIAGVLIARHGFSSRVLRTRGRVTPLVLLATVPPAALAVAVVCAAAFVAGLDLTMLNAGIGFAVVLGVLVLAAGLRAAEVRYLLNARRVFLVASPTQRADVEREIRRDGSLTLVGAVAPLPPMSVEGLTQTIAAARPTMLVLSAGAAQLEGVVAAASAFHASGGRVRDLNGFYERHFRKVPLAELTPSWFLFDVAEIHRPRVYLAGKRAIEVALAAGGLVVVSPVLLGAAVAIKLTSRGPVLFRQQRVGKDDHPFDMLKLRTMRVAEPDAEARWAAQEVARITPVGRVLRRWRLDELPQLVNVLLGHLSLVGPRPEQVRLVARLEEQLEFYSARHRVRPGLTGWAQVNYGYGGSDRGTFEKLQFDFYYIRHQSLRLDLLVIVMTLRAVLRGDSG